jgi:two-component system chemotaxis response regulator CheY
MYYLGLIKNNMANSTAIIIDDEPHITQLYSELLELQNLKILGIGQSGNDAIRLFKEYRPDLVFLDVHMPDKTGVEALKEIKKISPTAKVIMVTADLSEDLEKLLQDSGATATIFKPFDMQKITQLLEMLNGSDSTEVQK